MLIIGRMGTDGLLSDLRVVDFTTGLAGAYCAKLFADAGADVVLAEPVTGHPHRRWSSVGEPSTSARDAPYFAYLRHGQRSVVATDEASTQALVDGADVVLCDERSDIGDPTALATAAPDLVVVSITPFGLHGPYAGRAATELIIQAESGALAVRGVPWRPPVQAAGQVTEMVTGAYAAVGALAAARAAATSGRGELVDVSWAEVANLTGTLFADLFDSVSGAPELAVPSRSFESPSIEPTSDGFVGFNTNTRQQFSDFMVMIEQSEITEQWAILTTRVRNWDEWNAIVHEWTTRHTTAEVIELAALLRIPVAPVTNAETVLALDHVEARGIFVDSADGSFKMPRRPWLLDGESAPAPRPSPAIGGSGSDVSPRARRAASASGSPTAPFAGLTVVDMTAWWAGPSMTAMFSAFGADVIHVESIAHPDGMRMPGGMFYNRDRWWELSGFFMASNTNKRDITLDLSDRRGRELLLQLVADADVVVENFTPRVLEAFDLGWDVIHAANPRAVMVRMPAFGLDGPWRDRPGFAQTMEQVTGLAWVTGFADDQPRIQRGPCDPNAGMHAAFAAMVAIEQRDRTGVGCFVEAPMFEAALAIAAEPVVEFTSSGQILTRHGNRSVHAAPQGVYACDGTERWLALSVATDEQWQALTAVIDHPSWRDDADLRVSHARQKRHDEIDDVITDWAASRAVEDAVAALVAAGVPAAVVVDQRRTRLHPQFVARRFHEMVDHPVGGLLATPGPPFRFASVDHWITTPAPTLGQDNDEILTALGCTPDEIAALADAKVIGTRPTGL